MGFSEARLKAGLTQREVAEKLKVTPAAVAFWDTEKTKPRASILPKIAELYGCSIDDLLKSSRGSNVKKKQCTDVSY